MDITSNDPHIVSYYGLEWNLGEASVGETWTVSVYAKASTNISCQIFIFGTPAGGGYVEAPAGTIPLTTEWQRVSFTHTFTNANTVYIQSRLDGPDTGGAGESIWFDGWQVERGSTSSNFTSDYTSGNVLDISANSNNGTIVSSPQYNNSNGGYVTFDGSNDSIGLGVTAGELGIYDSDYTFEAWIYPTDISALSGDNFIFGTPTSVLREGLHLGFRNTNIYQGHYSSDYVSGTVTANQWYHLAWTYEKNLGAINGTAKIYKNGQLQPNPGTINSFIGSAEIQIGKAFASNPPHFQGRGALFKIYNRALTSKEVLQNFDAQKVRYGTLDPEPTIVKDGLVLNLDAGNKNSYPGSGTTWYDLSGFERDATLFNNVQYDSDLSGSLDFNRTNDSYATIPHDATISSEVFGTSNNFTLSAWFVIDQYASYSCFIQKATGGWYSNTTAGLWSEATNRLLFVMGSNETSNPSGSTLQIVYNATPGVWYNMVGVADGTTARLYINGNQVGTANIASTLTRPRSENTANITIGTRSVSTTPELDGRISNVSVYNRGLSAAEVLQNYNALKGRYLDLPKIVSNGLILNLDAGNTGSYSGSGATWTDIIGERQATLNGSPTFSTNYFNFNGVDQNVVFPSSVEVSTAGFTMGFLMRVPDLQNGTGWNFMLADKDSGSGSFEMGIYANTARNFIFKDNDNPSGQQSVSTDLGSDWVYLTFGMNEDLHPWIYVNGQFRTRLSVPFTSATLDFTQLFSYNNAGYFKGDFSVVQLYNRALSAKEIQQNFEVLRGRFVI